MVIIRLKDKGLLPFTSAKAKWFSKIKYNFHMETHKIDCLYTYEFLHWQKSSKRMNQNSIVVA